MENIHYRCTFDVQPAQGSAVGLVDLVHEIAKWIGSKEGRWSLRPQELLRDSELRSPKRSTVRTAVLGDPSRVLPEIWALRYTHADPEFAAREWQTDFGISEVAPHRWRFAVTVGNSLRPNFMGQEPGKLPVTPPRIVKVFVGSAKWVCVSGTTRLQLSPVKIAVGQGNRLTAAIADARRGCPLVYVSCERGSGAPLVDPERLASHIVGAGVVYTAESSEIDEELEHLIERDYRAPNGMVRVYAPEVDLNDVRASFRHRFFDRRRVAELGPLEVEDQIARSLTRRLGWAKVRTSVASVEDVSSRVRDLRLTKLRQNEDQGSREELIKLFDEANDRLAEENKNLQKQLADTEDAKEEALLDVEALNDKVRGLEYEVASIRKDLEEQRREAGAYKEAATAARGIARLPESLAEMVDLVGKLHADRVVFTPRARESAERAAINKSKLDDAWECLHAIASVLPSLVFDNEVSEGALSDRFQAACGFELSLTEGKATKNDAKFLAIRKVNFDGQEWDIKPHVKLGTKESKLLRVHFALDHDRKRVIVGHCGDHLDTAGTRRH